MSIEEAYKILYGKDGDSVDIINELRKGTLNKARNAKIIKIHPDINHKTDATVETQKVLEAFSVLKKYLKSIKITITEEKETPDVKTSPNISDEELKKVFPNIIDISLKISEVAIIKELQKITNEYYKIINDKYNNLTKNHTEITWENDLNKLIEINKLKAEYSKKVETLINEIKNNTIICEEAKSKLKDKFDRNTFESYIKKITKDNYHKIYDKKFIKEINEWYEDEYYKVIDSMILEEKLINNIDINLKSIALKRVNNAYFISANIINIIAYKKLEELSKIVTNDEYLDNDINTIIEYQQYIEKLLLDKKKCRINCYDFIESLNYNSALKEDAESKIKEIMIYYQSQSEMYTEKGLEYLKKAISTKLSNKNLNQNELTYEMDKLMTKLDEKVNKIIQEKIKKSTKSMNKELEELQGVKAKTSIKPQKTIDYLKQNEKTRQQLSEVKEEIIKEEILKRKTRIPQYIEYLLYCNELLPDGVYNIRKDIELYNDYNNNKNDINKMNACYETLYNDYVYYKKNSKIVIDEMNKKLAKSLIIKKIDDTYEANKDAKIEMSESLLKLYNQKEKLNIYELNELLMKLDDAYYTKFIVYNK